MKVLGRSFIFVIFVTLFVVQITQASCWNLADVSCLAPRVLGDKYTQDKHDPKFIKEWSAIYGRTYPINKGLVFAFRFDTEATTQFMENDLLALEFDFIVRGSRREEVEIDKIVTSSNLNNAEVGYDTPAFDGFTNGEDTRTIGVHILKPQVLRAGQLYIIVVKTKNELPTNNITFTPSVQITLNLADFAHLSSFFGVFGFVANEIVDFYDEFKQDKYFVLETDPFGNSFTPGDGCKVGWDDHVNSRLICDEIENNDNNVNIFTVGYHTHIIHPTDFRCSNNLCWSPSLDTSEPDNQRNCCNADNWYQITNGNYNGSQTYRNRSMCNEVYSDLDIDNDGDGFTENQGDLDDADRWTYPGSNGLGWGNGAGSDLDDDPNISVDSVKIEKWPNGEYMHSVGKNLEWGESLRIRLDTKVCNESELEARDVDWEYFVEDNKDFDDDDTELDDDNGGDIDSGECESHRSDVIKIKVSDDGQTVRVSEGDDHKTIDVVNNFCKVYFFIAVEEDGRSNGDDDISSESNKDEYAVARITVKDPAITADFSASVLTGTAPLSVSFTDSSVGVVRNRNWYFGDGTTSTSTNPSHTYTLPGVYTVTLAVRNKDHAESGQVTIVVNEPVPEDTDGDGVIDDNEIGDTDGDGLFDWEESNLSDIDNDGVSDELDSENTNPANDSDADGYTNEEEKVARTNPLDAGSIPVNSEDYCQETAETETNGGYGWNPVQEISCVPESQDFCHETAQTATNGGWGWNPYTEEGCEWEDDGNNSEPECIDEDGDGWGWNGTESCQMEPSVNQDYCHETAETATNGGWGWNPVTEQGCLVEDDSGNSQNDNLIQNFNFSNGWDNWIDATWNVTSTIDIFDNRAVVTIADNSNGGDAKLFHNEVSVTAGNYTFGATITNDVEVTAMLYLKKADGSDEWNWAGVISPSAEEQTVTFTKTLSSDITTARVIMSIKDVGTLGIDDYFLRKE